jgi:tetratricopeptide (TPR) repeat protein
MTTASPPLPLPSDAELEARLADATTPADADDFVALAPRLAGIGRAHIARLLAQRALEFAEGAGNAPLRIAALRARARAQSELAEYTGVVRSLLEAQSVNREVGDPEQELRILSVLGMAYGKLGARADAIASHEAALKISAGRGAELESECYGNLGITLLNCERMGEAVAMLRRAKARADESDDTMIKLRARVNLNAARASAADWQLRRGPNAGASRRVARDAGRLRIDARRLPRRRGRGVRVARDAAHRHHPPVAGGVRRRCRALRRSQRPCPGARLETARDRRAAARRRVAGGGERIRGSRRFAQSRA